MDKLGLRLTMAPQQKQDEKRLLKQPMLKADNIWNLESDSEPELDIQFQQTIDKEDSSDQSTLQNVKKKAIKQKKQAKQSQRKHQLESPERTDNTSELQYPSQPRPSHEFDIPRPSKTKPPQRKQKQQPTKRPQKPISNFERKSKEAAIAQTKLNKAKERQRQLSQSPRIQLDTTKLQANKSIEVINLISDSSQGSPIKIYTSNDPTAFMNTPATKNTKTPERVNRKIDKIIHRITHSQTKNTRKTNHNLSPSPQRITRVQTLNSHP